MSRYFNPFGSIPPFLDGIILASLKTLITEGLYFCIWREASRHKYMYSVAAEKYATTNYYISDHRWNRKAPSPAFKAVSAGPFLIQYYILGDNFWFICCDYPKSQHFRDSFFRRKNPPNSWMKLELTKINEENRPRIGFLGSVTRFIKADFF
jgi:hypothetical protein